MKWLQGNPVGMALAGLSGLFLLLTLGMAIVATLPVTVEVVDTGSEITAGNDSILSAGQIGDLHDYQVINERPVFNESRLPVIEEDTGVVLDEALDDAGIAVKDAPDVRLTGIIITPSMKIASLTPAEGDQESIMAHEGESLVGEYVGWQVSSVKPRSVTLESRDGGKLELELLVHDATIKEPPKPAPVAQTDPTTRTEPGQSEADQGGDDEPLSRAEQIRQRIAERREELRREQEEQGGGQASAKSEPVDTANAYQNAIRNKIRSSRKDKASNDKEDG